MADSQMSASRFQPRFTLEERFNMERITSRIPAFWEWVARLLGAE